MLSFWLFIIDIKVKILITVFYKNILIYITRHIRYRGNNISSRTDFPFPGSFYFQIFFSFCLQHCCNKIWKFSMFILLFLLRVPTFLYFCYTRFLNCMFLYFFFASLYPSACHQAGWQAPIVRAIVPTSTKSISSTGVWLSQNHWSAFSLLFSSLLFSSLLFSSLLYSSLLLIINFRALKNVFNFYFFEILMIKVDYECFNWARKL